MIPVARRTASHRPRPAKAPTPSGRLQGLRTRPLLAQHDLRNILVAASRIAHLGGLAPFLPRDLSRAERQLLSLCAVICELVTGTLGADLEGEPVGNLTLRAQPYVQATYQPRLGGNGK